jgi:hypothetical protein
MGCSVEPPARQIRPEAERYIAGGCSFLQTASKSIWPGRYGMFFTFRNAPGQSNVCRCDRALPPGFKLPAYSVGTVVAGDADSVM